MEERETLSATAATTTTCGRLWSSVVVGSDHYYFFYVYCLSTFEECAWSNGDGGTSPSGLAPSLSWFARGAGTDSSACSVSQCGTTLPTLWPWPPVFQPQSLSLSLSFCTSTSASTSTTTTFSGALKCHPKCCTNRESSIGCWNGLSRESKCRAL